MSTLPAVMLDHPYVIRDAIENGVEAKDGKDGDTLAVFDQTYAFAVLRVQDGIAKEIVTGPFTPPTK